MAFTEADIGRFEAAFRSMLTYQDGDESIRSSDLSELIKTMNWEDSEAKIKKFIEFNERERDGVLALSSFIHYMVVQHDPNLLLLEHAMTFDTDKDGFISAQEFKFMLGILKGQEPTLSPGTFEEFLLQADTDKDGRVSVEELKAWLQKKT